MIAPTAMRVCGLTLETFTAAVHLILRTMIADTRGVCNLRKLSKQRGVTTVPRPILRATRELRLPDMRFASFSWLR
jgi:hypothetical protein